MSADPLATLLGRLDGPVSPRPEFADALLARLQERRIALHKVTLHVGAGTFLPVKVDDTAAHHMHGESGSVSAATAEALNAVHGAGGRIVAVGSTALRQSDTDGSTSYSTATFAAASSAT